MAAPPETAYNETDDEDDEVVQPVPDTGRRKKHDHLPLPVIHTSEKSVLYLLTMEPNRPFVRRMINCGIEKY
jgi:hypothetical protein